MSADRCRPVTVTGNDGQPITVAVHGAEPMDETTRGFFEQLVQAAQRRYAAEHPAPELCGVEVNLQGLGTFPCIREDDDQGGHDGDCVTQPERDGTWPPCCDLHGRNCEPPSELCCHHCTEAQHPEHADGRPCSTPDLSPNRVPNDVEIRVAAEIRAEHRACDPQGCGLGVLTADDVLAVVHMVEVYARGSAR